MYLYQSLTRRLFRPLLVLWAIFGKFQSVNCIVFYLMIIIIAYMTQIFLTRLLRFFSRDISYMDFSGWDRIFLILFLFLPLLLSLFTSLFRGFSILQGLSIYSYWFWDQSFSFLALESFINNAKVCTFAVVIWVG